MFVPNIQQQNDLKCSIPVTFIFRVYPPCHFFFPSELFVHQKLNTKKKKPHIAMESKEKKGKQKWDMSIPKQCTKPYGATS